MARVMVHRLHGYDKNSTTATCEACGEVEIFWKSRGKDRPRTPVCRNAHEMDRRLQRLRKSDTIFATGEVQKIRLKQTYLAEEALDRVGKIPDQPISELYFPKPKSKLEIAQEQLMAYAARLRSDAEKTDNRRTKWELNVAVVRVEDSIEFIGQMLDGQRDGQQLE